MSPLDDELRTALSSRTASFTPSPGFFAGVERRATRLRRQRVAATVAGSALAVSALAVGGPLLVSSLTSTAPGPSELATTAPTPVPSAAPVPAVDYALDPADPWEYRGDPSAIDRGMLTTSAREWSGRRGAPSAFAFTPLYGEVFEPSGQTTLVFVARVGDEGAWHWGVVSSSESGPEILVDVPLAPGTTALAAALPGDEVSRLLVVASPEVSDVEYVRDGEAFEAMSPPVSGAAGVGVAPLDGDAPTDRVRVLAPDGETVFEGPAPDGEAVEGEPEGPGTDVDPGVDTAPYALDLDEPWAYRGPAELTLHPDLGAQDQRLFVQTGSGRDDGSWSQRPLFAVEDEPTGLSVLVVLHRSGDDAFVTTTWQRQDEAPRQSEQPVRDGQLLVQTVLPDVGPAGLLIAMASPQAGVVETDVVPRFTVTQAAPGVLTLELPVDPPAGSVFLYTEGDGLLYHSEPARRS